MNKSFGPLLLIAGLALSMAERAVARDIQIQSVTVLWSSLSPLPTSGDTITITDGGTLYVDVTPATVGRLTIGDATTAGSVLFENPARVLNVTGDVQFGASSANLLNMSGGTAAHTLNVGGIFLASGAGTFNAGLGTVGYNGNGAQTVTARVGATTIQYNNLTLAGSGAKTIQNGVTVQRKLIIQNTATVAGSVPINYGGLASLEYRGSAAQTTTGVEWPSPMTAPVSIFNANGVKLDANKTIAAPLTIEVGATLNTDGRNLTSTGAIVNRGIQTGAGAVILAGGSAQALTGTGPYANLTLNNTAGATTDPNGLFVDGRLTLTTGRLTLSSAASTALLLSLNGADQTAAGTYGSSASPATIKDDTRFAGTGIITLASSKPDASFDLGTTTPTIPFGQATATISGRVTGGLNGNVARDGELVTVRIETGAIPLTRDTVTTGGNGSFSATFDTATVPAGSYPVRYAYAGGINLKPVSTSIAAGFVVTKLSITVTPRNATKVYATTDPALAYDFTPALVAGDGFSGSLTRELAGAANRAGEQVRSYAITQGTLNLPANYNLVFAAGRTLTITKRAVSIAANAKNKTYGDADPVFDYTVTPPTLGFPEDHTEGTLARVGAGTSAGENVGGYAINQGSLKIAPGDNYTINYTPAILTISRRPVSIGVATGNLSKTYGDADKTLTPVPTPGLAFSDKFDGTLHRASGEAAGSYPIDIGSVKVVNADGTADRTANYNLSLQSLTFVINKRPVTISADSKTVNYGSQRPPLVKYDGLIRGSTLVPDQDTTVVPATVGGWTPSEPTVTSLPRVYNFSVNQDASDPNYSVQYTGLAGTLTIQKAPLTVRADNKTKVEDGTVFPPSSFTASYNFVAGDTAATAFTGGAVKFTGDAISATKVGTYTIDTSTSTYTSDKYTISYASGLLVITKGVSTTTIAGNQTWGPGDVHSWQINQANGGTAGSNPGWNLLNLTPNANESEAGILNITATSNNKFTIFLTTLTPGTPASGPMAQFDPTRPYAWTIVRAAGGIQNFAADKFVLRAEGSGLFANPTFGGTFGITAVPAANPTQLQLTFTPTSQFTAEVAPLFASVMAGDVDVMYLQPSKTSITPQETVTIGLNVANLHQPVFGAQAFLRFDSRFFVATTTGAGSPVVAPGGGVWDNVIYRMWKTDGQLDTVVGLSFSAPLGTQADGTVALITLTPTRTATGKSRVIFRGDNEVMDGGIVGGTLLTGGAGSAVLPARVMTEDILIVVDNKGPVIDLTTATQVQYGTTQNVKNGPSVTGDPAYSTNSVQGTVNISVQIHDLPGVGLTKQPTVKLTGPSSQAAEATCTNPGTADGVYNYTWAVTGDTENGKWTAKVEATDMAGNVATPSTFTLGINRNQITGIVELDSFRGANRDLSFAAGEGTKIAKSWPLNLDFSNTMFMEAGGFRDLPALAAELLTPKTAVQMSTALRYGSVAELPTLASRLLYGTDGVATYLRDLLFGYIFDVPSLNVMAGQLKSPSRSIDAYIRGRLSASTIDALNNYPATNPSAAQIAALENGLLNDFTDIVLGASIYDPLRFQSVTPPVESDSDIAPLLPPHVAKGAELVYLNRLLLNAAYHGYIYGQLNAATAQGLLDYTGGADATLVSNLLLDFDMLSLPGSSALWGATSLYTEMRFLGIPLRPATQALVLTTPAVTGSELVLLNRMLLEDGLASSFGVLNYASGPIAPATAEALSEFVADGSQENQAALEPKLVSDLNKAMSAGSVTRVALETAYPTQIAKYRTLAPFTLIHVPDGTTMVSAKSAWNVRSTIMVLTGEGNPPIDNAHPTGTANFVSGGRSGSVFNTATDRYLRAGDVTADNMVSLADYSVLQQTYGSSADLRSDLNGDGAVNILDYTVLQKNFGVIGNTNVDGKP